LPQYLALSVSGGATQTVGDLVSGCGVGHVHLLLQYLTLSIVGGTDDEQAVGKLDVLLQYLALSTSTEQKRRQPRGVARMCARRSAHGNRDSM
jgi:hypothetical protein